MARWIANRNLVCGIEYIQNKYDNSTAIGKVVDVAGDYFPTLGVHLESSVYRLKNSGSHGDSEKEGVRVELSGGKQPFKKSGTPQKAIIEFLCDRTTDGKDTEVDDRPEDVDAGKKERLRRREEVGDDKKEGDGDEKKGDETEKPKSPLQFLSYKEEDNSGVLRLEWRSKFACEDAVNASKDGSARWGFFTWLLIV